MHQKNYWKRHAAGGWVGGGEGIYLPISSTSGHTVVLLISLLLYLSVIQL